MKQRGSALIIAMMLIATVGATAFGIARLLYIDTAISTTYENGTMAYYSAESGLEEGFLRYKYNMNAEVPYKDWVVQGIPQAKNVFRSNLFDNSVIIKGGVYTDGQGIDTDTPLVSSSQQIYDLRMGYLGTYNSANNTFDPKFYHQIDTDNGIDVRDVLKPNFSTGDYSFLRIPTDESRKFDLSNLDLSSTGHMLNIGFKFIEVINGEEFFTVDNECNAMAEIKFLITSPAGISKEYKAITSFNPTTCASYVGIEAGKLDAAESDFANGGWNVITGITGTHDSNTSDDIGYYYKLNDVLNKVLTKAGATPPSYDSENSALSDRVTMSIKPLYYDADAFFATNGCDGLGKSTCVDDRTKVVTGPYSYITSTGYFGGITRTLKANIDRQSGTLYDLYDYVLFSGS